MRDYYYVETTQKDNNFEKVTVGKVYKERIPENTSFKDGNSFIRIKYFFSKDLAEFYASTLTI